MKIAYLEYFQMVYLMYFGHVRARLIGGGVMAGSVSGAGTGAEN